MKRGVVFILLFIISSFIFSCSSSSGNGSSGGINYIYGEPESSAKEITGIKTAGNYIELLRDAGEGELTYNIGAVAQPADAENKALLYTSSNPDLAEVSNDGIVTIKGLGTFSITIRSAASADIWQEVTFLVRENTVTALDVNDPLSFFGIYSISQYGINKSPDKNVGGSFSVNADRKAVDSQLPSKLLFNGVEVPITLSLDIDLSSMPYDEIALSVFEYLKYEIKDDKTVVIGLDAANHPELVEKGIIKGEETLNLALKKEYDLLAGSNNLETSPVSVTEINAGEEITIDRLIETTRMLKTEVMPVNADNKAVTYKSSNENVAKVSPTGVITAMGNGEAEITIVSAMDSTVTGTVKVKIIDTTVRVKDIKFTNTGNTIYLDTNGRAKNSITVKAIVVPANATYKSVHYYSKHPLIATVNSATGEVKPRRKGVAEIVAVSDRGSIEKSVKINVAVEKVAEPVKAIVNVPAKLDMSLDKNEPIKLDAQVVPSYADDTAILYKSDNENVTVDETGLITAHNVGRSVITVYSAKYPDVKKEITVDVRQLEEKIYVSSINLNEAPSTLYMNYSGPVVDHVIIPEIVPDNANIDADITVTSEDENVAIIEKTESGYRVVPKKEGHTAITVQTANGVTREVSFEVKKVMNVKGHYKVDKAVYSYDGKTEEFRPDNVAVLPDNIVGFQGEFAVDLLEDKYQVRGRLQLTPAQPLQSYTFNNWRYIYDEKDIALVEANEDGSMPANPDKYANQTKDVLALNGIKITGEKTIEYTYTDESFQAVIYLTKVNDELMTAEDGTRKEILDRTIYMTPVDMENDPHSAEGYYEMTWFYGNPYKQDSWGYQPKFSHNASDRPTNSDLGITYMENGRKCSAGITCMGGKTDDGSVTNYKGAFMMNVADDNAHISSTMKVQMIGHEDIQVAGQTYLQFMHVGFGSLPLTQINDNKLISNDKSLTSSILSGDGKSYPSEATTLAYTFLPNNTIQFEMKFHGEWYYDKTILFKRTIKIYEMMYRAKKVSDRYIDLTTDRFASLDRSKSISENDVIATPPYTDKNAIPDLAKIVPLEDFTGTVTPIE